MHALERKVYDFWMFFLSRGELFGRDGWWTRSVHRLGSDYRGKEEGG